MPRPLWLRIAIPLLMLAALPGIVMPLVWPWVERHADGSVALIPIAVVAVVVLVATGFSALCFLWYGRWH